MSGLSLRLEFDREDSEFAMGFECGRVWAFLQLDNGPFDCEMHARYAEMILRMAESCGRTVRSEELGDGWLTVSFGGGPVEVDGD